MPTDPAFERNITRPRAGGVIAAAILILPVGVVMLIASTLSLTLAAAAQPFAFIRDRASALLEALLRQIGRP